jgi:hypothetical protein
MGCSLLREVVVLSVGIRHAASPSGLPDAATVSDAEAATDIEQPRKRQPFGDAAVFLRSRAASESTVSGRRPAAR